MGTQQGSVPPRKKDAPPAVITEPDLQALGYVEEARQESRAAWHHSRGI